MPKSASDALVTLTVLVGCIVVPYALTYGLLYAAAAVSSNYLFPVPD